MGREVAHHRHQRGVAVGLAVAEEVLVAAPAEALDVRHGQVGHLDGVAAHLAERDAEIGLLPGAADGVLTHPPHERVRRLLVGDVDDAERRVLDPEVARDLVDAPVPVEAVVEVRRLDHGDVAHAELGEPAAELARAAPGR